jgi:hypothetical protein
MEIWEWITYGQVWVPDQPLWFCYFDHEDYDTACWHNSVQIFLRKVHELLWWSFTIPHGSGVIWRSDMQGKGSEKVNPTIMIKIQNYHFPLGKCHFISHTYLWPWDLVSRWPSLFQFYTLHHRVSPALWGWWAGKNVPQVSMTNKMGKWEFYIIYTYLWSIFASNSINPKEERRDLPKHRDVPVKGRNRCRWVPPTKILPNTYFRGPKEGRSKKDCMPRLT